MKNRPDLLILRTLPFIAFVLWKCVLTPDPNDFRHLYRWDVGIEMGLLFLCAVAMAPQRLRWDWRVSVPLFTVINFTFATFLRLVIVCYRLPFDLNFFGTSFTFSPTGPIALLLLIFLFYLPFRMQHHLAWATSLIGLFALSFFFNYALYELPILDWAMSAFILLVPLAMGIWWLEWKNSIGSRAL